MPVKLKQLNVTSVDFVDAGANPGAKISLYKRANPEENALTKVFKSIGVSGTEFVKSLTEKLMANLEKFQKADLTTALAQVVKNLQGQVEKAADKEFVELAKKYEILGLKTEELSPMLKQAKRTDPTLYETAVTVMDGAVAAIEPMFAEVGKRGAGFIGDAKTQVERMASEIRKK